MSAFFSEGKLSLVILVNSYLTYRKSILVYYFITIINTLWQLSPLVFILDEVKCYTENKVHVSFRCVAAIFLTNFMRFKEKLLSLDLPVECSLEREVVLPTGINGGTQGESCTWNMRENSSSALLLLCGLGVTTFIFSKVLS